MIFVALVAVVGEWLGIDRRHRQARARGGDRLPTFRDRTGEPFRVVR